jgi:hypothetical protein
LTFSSAAPAALLSTTSAGAPHSRWALPNISHPSLAVLPSLAEHGRTGGSNSMRIAKKTVINSQKDGYKYCYTFFTYKYNVLLKALGVLTRCLREAL